MLAKFRPASRSQTDCKHELELAIGVLAQPTALIADALDMLADATVYGISQYAAG